MLQVAVTDGIVDPKERELLVAFGRRHGISEEDQCKILAELGWTIEEFRTGRLGSNNGIGWFSWLY